MRDLFGLDERAQQDTELAFLTTVHDNAEQAMVESILRGEQIPYLMKERGSGSAVKIIAGFSMFGTDFYVPQPCVEQAKALIEPDPELVAQANAENEANGIDPDGEENE